MVIFVVMIPSNTRIYLETSAVNYLADKYHCGDAKATRIYHELKGTKFYISPITIWEILLTADEGRREVLILYMQNIGYRQLINSPSELIINYIKAGCPLVEKQYNFHSHLQMGETWSDICDNTNKTLRFDQEPIKKGSKLFLYAINQASKLIEDVGIVTLEKGNKHPDQIWLDNILLKLKGMLYDEMDSETKRTLKISVLLLLFIMCSQMDLDNTPIKEFWKERGIDGTYDRLEYLLKHHEELVYRGPFVMLAKMAIVQLNKGGKPTRGIYWDMLHSLYLIYTDMFFTNDSHFVKLKNSMDHPALKRITLLSEASIFTAKTMDLIPNPIIK
jgi:hypothetical protein